MCNTIGDKTKTQVCSSLEIPNPKLSLGYACHTTCGSYVKLLFLHLAPPPLSHIMFPPTSSPLSHMVQGDLREYYVTERVQSQCPLDRAKLLVCGGPGVGKTELINSLKCNVLRSLFRRRSNSNFQQMILRRTHGMSVQQATVPNVGLFSIWDFSGLKEFYVAHENFLGGSNSVFLLMCSLRDSVGKQLAQMRFWLAMIKARTRPGEIATRPVARRPFVVLVGSFADQENPMQGRGSLNDDDEDDVFAVPHPPSAGCPLDNGRSVLEKLSQEFGDSFDFSNTVFAVDCRLSQSAEMRSLRSLLKSLHTNIIKVSCCVVESRSSIITLPFLLVKNYVILD